MRRVCRGQRSGCDDQQKIVGLGFLLAEITGSSATSESNGDCNSELGHERETAGEVIGTCFTPQYKCLLGWLLAATMWFLYPDSYEDKLSPVRDYFFNEI